MLEEQKGMLENSNTMKDVFNTLKSMPNKEMKK